MGMMSAREEEENVAIEEEATHDVVLASPVGPIEIDAMEIEEISFDATPQEPMSTTNLRGESPLVQTIEELLVENVGVVVT